MVLLGEVDLCGRLASGEEDAEERGKGPLCRVLTIAEVLDGMASRALLPTPG